MHVSSYMLKNAFLNSNKETRKSLLKDLKRVIASIIKEDNLDIPLNGTIEYFDNKALYQFTIPTKSKSNRDAYTIILQAVRLAGLLHDVGHLPFSHQVEYALKKVYNSIDEKKVQPKENDFKLLYEEITNHSSQVLHEAIADNLIDTLFENELPSILKKEDLNYIKLIHKLVKYILEERVYQGFDFKVIHKIISSTVDADRLDYINRDMVASGYIGAANDHIRITKHTVFVKQKNSYHLSFLDMGLIDIEHMLEMRFNLYKKVIFNHGIAKTDALLENVVIYLSKKYFNEPQKENASQDSSISMLWNFLKEKEDERRLDIISMLDENWLISLFKKEYFTIKNKENLSIEDRKYLLCFEEVLFGKRFFKSPWKNLNEFYKVLDFTTIERYKFRESFGYITDSNLIKLQKELDAFIYKWENSDNNTFFSYQIVSFKLGIEKDFTLYDTEELIPLDAISTLRKRLKHSMQNTVPFYIYTNKKEMSLLMKEDLKEILFKIFTD